MSKMSNQVRISSDKDKECNNISLLESAMQQMYQMQLAVVKSNLPPRQKVYEGIVNAIKKSEGGHFDPMMITDHIPKKYKEEYDSKVLEVFKSLIEKMEIDELLQFIKNIDNHFKYNKPSHDFASKDVSTVLTSILL